MRLLRRTTLCVVAVIAGLGASVAVAHAQTVASTTTVSVSPDPTLATQTATLTAVVTGTGGTPTGTVQFTRGGTAIGQATLSNGTARLPANAGPAGSSDVQAAYSGDGSFDPSSGTVRWTVRKADTVTTLESSANPVASGVMFELTAWVAIEGGVSGDGIVEFTVNGNPFYSTELDGYDGVGGPLQAVGPASLTFAATYSGDANTNPSSASLIQQVAGPPTPPPPPPPPPTPTPTPVATMTATTLRQMTAGLRGTLRQRGLGGLGGATQTLATPVPGRLEQAVYTPSATAKKRTLLAKARRTFAAAGTGKLTLRLTAAGRRKLRTATRLKLAIVTRFTPQTGPPVTVVDRLTARKRSARAARALSWHVVNR